MATRQRANPKNGHKDGIRAIIINQRGSKMFTCSFDKSIRVLQSCCVLNRCCKAAACSIDAHSLTVRSAQSSIGLCCVWAAAGLPCC